MNKPQAKPPMADVRIGNRVGVQPPELPEGVQPDEAAQRQSVRDFIRAMSAELSVMAHRNGLEALALIFETARETADAETAAERGKRS